MSQDNFKPPLTTQQLHEIGRRRSADDVIALLWEIKRLRALVLRGNQIAMEFGGENSGHLLVRVFKEELQGEPVLEDMELMRIDRHPNQERSKRGGRFDGTR